VRAFELGEGGLLVLRGWTPLSVGLHPAVAPLRQCNGRMLAFVPGSALWGVYTIQQTSSSIITYGSKRPTIHLYFEYICWKFAGRLLDRVNTLLAALFQLRSVAARNVNNWFGRSPLLLFFPLPPFISRLLFFLTSFSLFSFPIFLAFLS